MKPVSDFPHLIKSNDRILITDLKLSAIIGVHDWEKKNKQDILLTISMAVDTSDSVISDNLKDTVDYDYLSKSLEQYILDTKFDLIETLADSCARFILSKFKILDIFIQLDKPNALPKASSVAIQIYRTAS